MLRVWVLKEEDLENSRTGFKEIYQKMLNSVENGKKIFIGETCNDSDDIVSRFIYYDGLSLSNNKNFDIIANGLC